MKAVKLTDVYVSYENRYVLKDVDLEVEDKTFLGIIGPNGGGKTTLLKVISGLIKPDKGIKEIYGKKCNNSKMVGYVPQTTSFDHDFPVSVMDVILMGRLNNRIQPFHNYSNEDFDKAYSIMKKLEITDVKNRQIGQLSGGQLQKVLIARALVSDPNILLLDEPTSSIDASSTSVIYSLLNDLNKEITIIVVTHNLAAVSSYFDSIACLNKKLYYHGNGEIKEETIDKVFGCPIDLIAHGIPHRVLATHEEDDFND